MEGVEEEVGLELRAQDVEAGLGELPRVGRGRDAALARLPGMGHGFGGGDDHDIKEEIGAEESEDAPLRRRERAFASVGPRQRVVEQPHHRAADGDEEKRPDGVQRQEPRGRRAGNPDPQRAPENEGREERAGEPARELLDDEPVRRGRTPDVRQHQRVLAGEHQRHGGPEDEGTDEQRPGTDEVPEPGPRWDRPGLDHRLARGRHAGNDARVPVAGTRVSEIR